jgi:hypothetical protein
MFAQGSDAEAKTLKALTSLALLQRDSGTVTFLNNVYVNSPANIWDARDIGYQRSVDRPNPFRAQNNANINQISGILKNSHLPVYLQAETDLSAFTSDTLLVPLGRTETGYPTISLDRGDILMIRALLACGRGVAYLINSQNSSILINDYISLEEESGPVTIEKFLAKFPDAAKLATPSDLPLARQEFKNSISLYKQASEWVRTKRGVYAVRLFNLPGSFGVNPGEVYTAGLADEVKFQERLDEYALLLDGSSLVTGFDNKPIDTLNAKPFFDGLVNLRSILPSFRKNKIRQGEVTDSFAKAGGVYPGNTIARTESWLLEETENSASDPYAFGLFVRPGITVSGPSSVQESFKPSKTIVGWGENGYGQTTIPQGLTGVTAIAAATSHCLALKSDGTVVGWGYNGNGQTTIPQGLTGVTAIAVGAWTSLALKSDGTIVGWGENGYGQTTIPQGLTGVTAIAAGAYYSLALKSDGTVVGWGANWDGQTTIPQGLTGVTAIAAGASHSLAIKSSAMLALNRSGDISEPILVSFSLNGTAGNGLDYTFAATPVALQPGNTQQPILFALVNDNVVEFDEAVVLTGTPNTESDSTSQTFTLTILDDDGSGIGIFATDNQGKEGRMNPDPFGFRFGVYDPIRFEVRRTGSTASAISVKVSRDALLSSASTDDYEITGFDVDGQSVRIPAGSSTAEILVSPKYDINYPEGTESLTLKISPDPAYTMMEYSSATGSIADSSPYEWWSYQMGVLISNQSPSLDTDKDGMPNLLEMALGRDPNLPDSPNAIKEGIDSEGYLTLTYKRWTGGTVSGDGSYAQYGVTYRPQASSTLELADWSSSSIQVVSITDTGDGMEEVVVRDTQSRSQPRRFMRISVTL